MELPSFRCESLKKESQFIAAAIYLGPSIMQILSPQASAMQFKRHVTHN